MAAHADADRLCGTVYLIQIEGVISPRLAHFPPTRAKSAWLMREKSNV
jgi:hypothetical protein